MTTGASGFGKIQVRTRDRMQFSSPPSPMVLSFVPDGNRLAAKLNVRCRNSQEAAELVMELSHVTTLLRGMIEREHHRPNPADLSGVLTSGSFRADGVRVFGYWPIERAFVENMLGGQG